MKYKTNHNNFAVCLKVFLALVFTGALLSVSGLAFAQAGVKLAQVDSTDAACGSSCNDNQTCMLTKDGSYGCVDDTDVPCGQNCDNGYSCNSGSKTCVSDAASGGTGAGIGSQTGAGTSGGSKVKCPDGFEDVNNSGVCVPNSGFGDKTLAGSKSWSELILRILQILMTVVGVAAVGAIVVGGFQYITAGGNEEQSEKGRKVLINAIIGLVLVMLAFAIVTVISNLFIKNTF